MKLHPGDSVPTYHTAPLMMLAFALNAAGCAGESSGREASEETEGAPSNPVDAPAQLSPENSSSQPSATSEHTVDDQDMDTDVEPIATGGTGGGGGHAGTDDVGGAGGSGEHNMGTAGAAHMGGEGGQGGTPPLPAVDCLAAGGLCLTVGDCEQWGGVPLDALHGCDLDDAEAVCCSAPDPQPEGTACTDIGGLCTSIGACLQSDGHSAPAEIVCEGGAGSTCCLPHDRCGDVNIDCCRDGATFRPACDGDQFVCVVGEPYPQGSCPR